MAKRTPVETEQKVVQMYRTGKYTEAQVGQRYGIPRQTVWAILRRSKTRPRPQITQSDMITLLNRIDWTNDELQDIWNAMTRCMRKKFNAKKIQINGQVYSLGGK